MYVLAFVVVLLVGVFASLGVYNASVHRFDPEGREIRARQIAREENREQRAEDRKEQARHIGDAIMKLTPLADSRRKRMASTLKRAGWDITVGVYWAATLASIAAGVVLGIIAAVTVSNPNPAARIALFGLLALIGLLAPRFFLSRAIKRRTAQISASLPGNLELLSVVVGAGLTVESGIRTVALRTEGPISDEFLQVSNDITYYGKTTQEALQDMADRCQTQEISLFVASMIQSMNAGSPVAYILKTQAELAMERYYQKIEEKSNMIRQKMIFPTVLFILPPIFIVSVGPTVLKLMEALPKIIG